MPNMTVWVETTLVIKPVQGATFIQSDYDKRTALHIAAAEGHIEVVKYLVTNGASVHARDRYDHVPLDDAIRFGHHDIIRILVQAGAHLTLSPTDIGVQLCR
jgi:lysophospholipase